MSDESSTPSRAPDPYGWEEIGRILAGESTPAEAQELRRRLAQNPDDAEMIAQLDRAIDRYAESQTAGDIDVEAALRAVKERRNSPSFQLHSAGFRRTPALETSTWRRTPFLVALAAGIVITMGVVVWSRLRPEVSGGPTVAVARVLRTAVGQRDSVMLPDSSLVVLGPRSELRVAASFGAGRREVELSGEAYFDVRHDDARPFVVRAGQAVIRDVGTVFTVQSDGHTSRVVVTEGSVLVHAATEAADRGVILHPGDVGVLEEGGPLVASRSSATDDDLAWIRGRLVFREAPLSEVAKALERWYGVTLRVPDTSTAGRHVKADFSGDSLESVLHQLSLILGAEYERNGDTVTFRPSGAGRIR